MTILTHNVKYWTGDNDSGLSTQSHSEVNPDLSDLESEDISHTKDFYTGKDGVTK